MEPDWPILTAVHAVAAGYALLFGGFNLLRRRRGDRIHRILGRLWVASMYVVCLTSFGIRDLDGGFSWLHGLSLFTLFSVTMGLFAAIRGNIPSHIGFMTGSYFGIVGAFVGVVVVPERRIPQMALTDLPGLFLWVAALVLTAAFTVAGVMRLRTPSPAKAHA